MSADSNIIEFKYPNSISNKIWRFMLLNRSTKEFIKNIIFSLFPYFFNKKLSYQNWEYSRPFRRRLYSRYIFNKIKYDYKFTFESKENSFINTLDTGNSNKKVAIVIHVFYFEIFKEILAMLKDSMNIGIKLFITCPSSLKIEIENEIQNTVFPFYILEVENRGRDVLPFLKILPIVFSEDFNFVMKLHTKKSGHLKRNHNWRNDLFEKLLNPTNINNFIEICSTQPEIGMIGPSGHILPISLYYGGNSENVMNILRRMGINEQKLGGSVFIAGTMFFATKDALLPILNIGLIDEEFEIESGQVDGTLAHALERVFSIIVNQFSLRIIDSDSKTNKIECKVTRNYKFTL